MIRALLLAACYVGLVAALLVAAAIHHNVTLELVGLVIGMAAIVGVVIFVDTARQQRRARRHPIIKDWNS